MLRRPSTSLYAAAISWPIDSALRPGLKLAPSSSSSIVEGDANSAVASSATTKTPLTRAKARWLLHRGAADAEVASVSIQTSTTWAAACNVVASLTAFDSTSSSSSSNNNKQQRVLSPAVLETLSLRLVQELRLNSSQMHLAVGGAHNLHRLQIIEALNAAAAEEVDLEPKGQHYTDKRAEEYGAVGERDEDEHDDGNGDGGGDAVSSSSSSSGDNDLAFSTRLALTNSGTLASNRGGPLAHRILDFCKQHHVPATPQLLSNLALLSCNWLDSLRIVKRAENILSTGAPLPVVESAMRSCCEMASFNRSWKYALALYNKSNSYQHHHHLLPATTTSVSYALSALCAMRIAAESQLVAAEERGEQQQVTERQHQSLDDTHWAWTLRLHGDASRAAQTDSFWLRGDSGAAVCSTACVSAALSRNWSLALSVLSNKCDTQVGKSLVDEDDKMSTAEQEKLLLIPDADALFAAIAACVAAGRYKEAASVTGVMFTESGGFNYTLADVSGRVLDSCVRLVFTKFHRAFAARLLAPYFLSAATSSSSRRLWTVQHCTAMAYAARCITTAAPPGVWLNNQQQQKGSAAASSAAASAVVQNMWRLAACAFAEYVQLSPVVPPRAAMLFGSGVLSHAEAMQKLIRYLAEDGVVISADDPREYVSSSSPSSSIAAVNSYKSLPLLACAFHSMRNDWVAALSLAMHFFESEKMPSLSSSSSSSSSSAEKMVDHQKRPLSKSLLVASRRLLYVLRQTRGAHWAAALLVASGLDSYDPRIRQQSRSLNEGVLQASYLRTRRQRGVLMVDAASDTKVVVTNSGADPRRNWRRALLLYAQCREVDQRGADLRGRMVAFFARTGLFRSTEDIDEVLARARRGDCCGGGKEEEDAGGRSSSSSEHKSKTRRVSTFDKSF